MDGRTPQELKQAIEQPLGENGATGEEHGSPHWSDSLDGRMRVHIAYARVYAQDYAHGAPGHLDLMTIAALAKLLDDREPCEDSNV